MTYNIIYIHTHDSGKLVSPYNYNVPTPNYERLFSDSIIFQNAFSVAPTCSPSRASLLTGLYPHQNGMLGLAQRGFTINTSRHLSTLLLNNGFLTALCGVQHEVGYYTDHALAVEKLGYELDLSSEINNLKEEELIQWDQQNADNICDFLINYDDDRPFFISYGMHSTHRRYPSQIDSSISEDESQPPLNIANIPETRHDFAQYKTSIKKADENVGKVIDALKKTDLYDKTIIILTTDHGIAYPFAKCTLLDSGIGVLLAMHVPHSKYPKGSFEGLISHIDVLPTLLDLLCIEKPDYLEGTSFSKIFDGESYKGDELIFSEINFHTSYEPVRSVRTKRYKYIRYFDTDYLKINRSNMDNSPIKTFYSENDLENVVKPVEALYDTYYDKFETNNLANDLSHQMELKYLRGKLKDFMTKTDDPLLKGPIKIQKDWKVNKRESYSPGSENRDDYDNI